MANRLTHASSFWVMLDEAKQRRHQPSGYGRRERFRQDDRNVIAPTVGVSPRYQRCGSDLKRAARL